MLNDHSEAVVNICMVLIIVILLLAFVAGEY